MVFSEHLVSIFIGVLLLENGFSLPVVLLLLAFTHTLGVIALFSAHMLIKKFGFKTALIAGSAAYVLYFLVVGNAEPAIFWLILYFITATLKGLYWFPFHTLFATQKTDYLGTWEGIKRIAALVAGALAPFIGGVALTYWEEEHFFLIAILSALVAVVPLLFLRINFAPSVHKLTSKIIGSSFKINALSGMLVGSVSVGWPLVVYFMTGSALETGILMLILLSVQATASFVAGRMFDARTTYKAVLAASAFLVVSVSFMAVLPAWLGILGIILAQSAYGASFAFFDTLRTLFWYKEANTTTARGCAYNNHFLAVLGWILGFGAGVATLLLPAWLNVRLEYVLLANIIPVIVLWRLFAVLSKSTAYAKVPRQ